MKFRTLMLGLAISLLPAISMSAMDSSSSNKNTATAAQIQKDGEILATVEVVDNNEIAIAKEVLSKKASKKVNEYAKMMVAQHTANLNDAEKLAKKTNIAPVESDASKDLQKQGKDALDSLNSLDGNDLDKAYIDMMVKGHTDVLGMIDDDFLKNVTNEKVKKFLNTTRSHVKIHLDDAEKIQKTLK